LRINKTKRLVKFVPENLNEIHFERGGDPLPTMGVGKYRKGVSKMGPGHEVLWSNGPWNIEVYTNPNTGTEDLVVVGHTPDNDDGPWDHTDYPIIYDDGGIAYDYPVVIPEEVRDKVREIYPTLRESVEFQRGKNPKEALDIGLGITSEWWEENSEIYLELKALGEKYGLPIELIDFGRMGKVASLKSRSKFNGIPINITLYYRDELGPGFRQKSAYESRVEQRSASWGLGLYQTLDEALAEIEKYIKTETVNEAVEFTRGVNPKTAMDIGQTREIRRWLEVFLLDDRAVIDGNAVTVDGGITFSSYGPNPDAPADLPTTFPMESLTVKGSFYLDRSKFTELPKSLIVKGPLDLSDTSISALPTILKVSGNLLLNNPGNPLVIPTRAEIDGHIEMLQRDRPMIEVPEHLEDLVWYTDRRFMQESVNFRRREDPKKSLGIGLSWETLRPGMILEIKSSLSRVKVTDVFDKMGRDKRIRYVKIDDKGRQISEEITWYLSPDWFKENIKIIGINESTHFQRGGDPKKSLDIGLSWRNLQSGMVLEVQKNMFNTIGKAGTRIQVTGIGDETHEGKQISYVKLDGDGNPTAVTGLWRFGEKFFKEYLKVIGLDESVRFQRGGNTKSSLDIGVARKAFPIIAINPGSGWLLGLECREFLENILSTMGNIPAYTSILVRRDLGETIIGPSMGKAIVSETWKMKSLQELGFTGIKWAHIFVPFSETTLDETTRFVRGQDPLDTLEIGRIVKAVGDRGVGEYRVRLIEPYAGQDAQPGEEIWKGNILSTVRNVYVIKFDEEEQKRYPGYWGIIDPFVEVSESVNFERGKPDIYKTIGIGAVRPYPQMSKDAFRQWFDTEILSYIDPEDGLMSLRDNLFMNTWETDEDVRGYLRTRGGISKDIIDELINMRDYFNDRDYLSSLAGAMDESLEFHRGGRPLTKIGIGKGRLKGYPEMTPNEFHQWYSSIEKLLTVGEPDKLLLDYVLDQLVNNLEPSDNKIATDFAEIGVDPDLIPELLFMRPYFWDPTYYQNI
jgi:hypothetical protein